MFSLIVGIILGWLIPRPKFLAPIEERIWDPVKSRIPKQYHWWG